MSENLTAAGQFQADLDLVIATIDRDEPPSADEKAAVGRLGRKLLVDLGTIANSLNRIAVAQEHLAGLDARAYRQAL